MGGVMDPLSYHGIENPYGMMDGEYDLLHKLLHYGQRGNMDQEKIREELGLTKVQFDLFKSIAVNGLFTYAQQIYDFEDDELPHAKEDVNAILELFNYRVEFNDDGVMYDLTKQ